MLDNNPYAPPAAAVHDLPLSRSETRALPWFAVSTTKLLVMSLCTLTLYQIYWFYRQWALVKQREGSSILPALRAIFGVFFCYSLFVKVREREASLPESMQLSAGLMAGGWIVLTVLWRLPDPYWWVAMGAIGFLLPVQASMNRQNREVAPDDDPNASFSAWNWVAVVIGGLVLAMAVIGSFMPEH